jgi:hypothetical protein
MIIKKLAVNLQAHLIGDNMQKKKILEWNPEFEIKEEGTAEGKEGKRWLKIGGLALTEGVSRNKNNYSVKNIQENNNQSFKWIVGHPNDAHPDHVVGKGVLMAEGTNLLHEGIIRNTAAYPDIVEKVQDGLIGPSIHASYDEIERVETEEGFHYDVTGLNIEGVSLVTFQGVKQASIDYAIAESYVAPAEPDKIEEEVLEDVKMEQETTKLQEENAILKKELEEMKAGQKLELVESLLKLNDKLDKEQLMQESESVLKVREEYEKNAIVVNEEAPSEKATEVKEEVQTEEEQAAPEEEKTEEPEEKSEGEGEAVVETEEKAEPAQEEFVVGKAGLTLSEGHMNKFNDEIRKRLSF